MLLGLKYLRMPMIILFIMDLKIQMCVFMTGIHVLFYYGFKCLFP